MRILIILIQWRWCASLPLQIILNSFGARGGVEVVGGGGGGETAKRISLL